MDRSRDEVIRRRLATHRLTSGPTAADPVEVVRRLLCVQAQDAPLARYSIGLRTTGADDLAVREVLDSGRLVRTHILRPTWHFVAAEDLRWTLALTSAKVESGMASRSRNLGVNESTIEKAIETLCQILGRRHFCTVAEVSEVFAENGLPSDSAVVRHLLLVSELRGVVCSGPLRDSAHTYGLVDELIPSSPPVDRDDAIRELVRRFFSGHGPASEQDLRRWTTLTLGEIRAALAELADVLEAVTVDEVILWFDPTTTFDGEPTRRALLLSTFDEAYLGYPSLNIERAGGHPRGTEPHSFGEAGGGVVVCDRRDAGWWKRTVKPSGAMTIRLGLASSLDDDQRQLVRAEAEHLAGFFQCELIIED